MPSWFWNGKARARIRRLLAALRQSGEITGKLLEFTLLHGLPGYKARRVLVAGAGKRDKFDAASLRKIAGAAVRFLKPKGIASIAFAVDRKSRKRLGSGRSGNPGRLGAGLPED